MERELFAALLRVLTKIPEARLRPHKATYTNANVIAVALWAALHDRPISWATQRTNWPAHDRTRDLPSSATMSRRLIRPLVETILNEMLDALRLRGQGERTLMLDGRPLTIAKHSGDPDADFGRAAGGIGKGYKLHAIIDLLGNCRAKRVENLRVSEQAAARDMLEQLEPGEADTLLGDKNYDSNQLYQLAGDRGMQLLTPRRFENAEGLGHCRHSEHRLRGIKIVAKDPGVLHARRFIESCFGTQGNRIGGLGPLPNHVRREHRVRRWVNLKLVIDAAHRWRKNQTKQP